MKQFIWTLFLILSCPIWLPIFWTWVIYEHIYKKLNPNNFANRKYWIKYCELCNNRGVRDMTIKYVDYGHLPFWLCSQCIKTFKVME